MADEHIFFIEIKELIMKQNYLSALANINIELTNRCNKKCWICGRRKIERDYPELALAYGNMKFEDVETIAEQLLPGIVVQLHNNGEPLLYPRLGESITLFNKQITSLDTNGKLLLEKADEIINNLDTLAISVIENDPEGNEQYKIIKEFLKIKGNKKPYTILRLNGDVDADQYNSIPHFLSNSALGESSTNRLTAWPGHITHFYVGSGRAGRRLPRPAILIPLVASVQLC